MKPDRDPLLKDMSLHPLSKSPQATIYFIVVVGGVRLISYITFCSSSVFQSLIIWSMRVE